MKLLLLIPFAALVSCGQDFALPGGNTGKATLGYYAPSSPEDPAAKLGLFVERVVMADK